jgi:uncharacterized protein
MGLISMECHDKNQKKITFCMEKEKMKKTVISVFLKAPVKGFVKTRLASVIGDDAALKIYIRFVKHTFDLLSQTRYPVQVYFYPTHEIKKILKLMGDTIPLTPQKGNHLGERMKNAIKDAFSKGFEKVILIGTDIPGLSADIIDDAVLSLNEYPAVIGPSMDGGYYLIGFHSAGFLPDIFTDMSWGTSEVFKKTMNCFAERNMHVRVLSQCRDIDTYKDLHDFLSSRNPNTLEYIDIINDIHPGSTR